MKVKTNDRGPRSPTFLPDSRDSSPGPGLWLHSRCGGTRGSPPTRGDAQDGSSGPVHVSPPLQDSGGACVCPLRLSPLLPVAPPPCVSMTHFARFLGKCPHSLPVFAATSTPWLNPAAGGGNCAYCHCYFQSWNVRCCNFYFSAAALHLDFWFLSSVNGVTRAVWSRFVTRWFSRPHPGCRLSGVPVYTFPVCRVTLCL